MMKIYLLGIGLCGLFFVGTVFASVAPPNQQALSPGTKVNSNAPANNMNNNPGTTLGNFSFVYKKNGIYRIYCKEQRLTDIQLQAGENILFVGAGDTVRWQVDSDVSGSGDQQQAHVYVKPLRSGISTNLIINTDQHNYHCEIISGSVFAPIVTWVYPKEKSAGEIPERGLKTVNGKIDYKTMSFNYKVCGRNYPWKPEMVFSDKYHVYIQMPKAMESDEAPVIFIKDSGKLQLVNYRVRDGYYILDRLFAEAEMICGDNTITIKRTKAR